MRAAVPLPAPKSAVVLPLISHSSETRISSARSSYHSQAFRELAQEEVELGAAADHVPVVLLPSAARAGTALSQLKAQCRRAIPQVHTARRLVRYDTDIGSWVATPVNAYACLPACLSV